MTKKRRKKDNTMVLQRNEDLFNYYLHILEKYREQDLVNDIRKQRIYDEVAERFYLSSNYVSKIIASKLKNGE